MQANHEQQSSLEPQIVNLEGVPQNPPTMLELKFINAAYGKSQVLWDINLTVHEGEAVALLGRNGVGKTTLLRTITGVHPISSGRIRFGETDLFSSLPAFERARRGLASVPQGRGIFPHLTVYENLLMGLPALSGRPPSSRRGSSQQNSSGAIPEIVFELFPILHEFKERKGGNLSGGQQQQLAIGRALVTQPKMLLLDEPTEGIQPSIVQEIETALTRVRTELGVAVLLVEQYLEFAWSFADRFYVMQKGQVVDRGSTKERTVESVEKLLSV
jgi:urea transport system ATP-binding protein